MTDLTYLLLLKLKSDPTAVSLLTGCILFSLLICQICEVGSFGDPGGMGLGWPKDPVSSSVSVFIQKKLNIIHPMHRWSLKINFVVE